MLCMALSKGERLALAREYFVPRMTQEHLAKLIGKNRTQIAKWETVWQDQVPSGVLAAAAAALQVREAYFYDKDVEGPPIGYRASDPLPMPPTPDEVAAYGIAQRSQAAAGIVKGDKVFLRCFRGVMAGQDGDDEAAYIEEELPRSVFAFITGGDALHHDVLIVRGNSMYPRVPPGSEVVVRHELSPKPGQIVVAKDSEGRTFIKALRIDNSGREYLESANTEFESITDISGWKFLAVAVAIITEAPTGSQQIEWDEGRALRA